MGDILFSLLGVCMGALLGFLAGKLVAAGIPLVQQLSPVHLDEGPAALVLLALIGAALGFIIRTFLDHPWVLPGALVSLLYFASALLHTRD